MNEGRKKLFVGNLSWGTSEDDLKTHFSKIGPVVSARIVADQYTGKSKGFGFIEMGSPELAEQAIEALNDKPFMDRNLRVSLALERPERSGGGGGGGGGRERSGGGGNRNFRSEGSQKPYRSRQTERMY